MKKIIFIFSLVFAFNTFAKVTIDDFKYLLSGTFSIHSHSCLSGDTPDMSKSADGDQNTIYVYKFENIDQGNKKLSFLTLESIEGDTIAIYKDPSTLVPIIDNNTQLVTGMQFLWNGKVYEEYSLESIKADEYTIARLVTESDKKKQCAVGDTKLTTFKKR